ncbi:hypothetical protein HFO56_23570 [Rhizobium laguerreae]|uniref:hypothetical protein n=1 Tax=Rhizobium laguerreae TaxID=1076926 RepID=UPI001C905A9C|nr:hypothetical protein [Rhizobium laguerreae]MBY3155306.1 hypothetical protein [Rhizobium laguerreae]
MGRMKNQIEAALLGAAGSGLRTVDGYNWVQHLAMSAILEDRRDAAQAWLHTRSAARSFLASLQLLARPGPRQWLHLSDEAVFRSFASYMLKTFGSHVDLFDRVYWRFKTDVAAVMTEVAPQLAKLCGNYDFSMLVNVYLNTVEKLPPGVGVYFVHSDQNPGFTAVTVYPPSGFQRYLANTRQTGVRDALDDATGYYAVLVSQQEAGNIALSSDELSRIEDAVTSLIAERPDAVGAESLMLSPDSFEAIETAPKYASPRF